MDGEGRSSGIPKAPKRLASGTGAGTRPEARAKDGGSSVLDAEAQARLAAVLSPDERYAWSWIRIWEQVTINVLTVVILAIGGAVFALIYQHLFNFIIVPTNLLLAVVFTSTGVLVTVALLALGMYLYMRKHPIAATFALAALLLGFGGSRQVIKRWADDVMATAQAKQPQNTAD